MVPPTSRSCFPALTASVLVWTALATGCSSAVPRREAAPAQGNQGGAWDLVLAGPVLADAGDGAEYSRRDEALQWAPPQSALTQNLAAPHGRPTLLRPRRVYTPRDPFGYIYYLDQYGYGRR